MRRVRIVGWGVLLLMGAVLAFWYRPWAEFRPAVMNSLFRADVRVENFQHMERVFPARVIPPSRHPQPWPEGAPVVLPAMVEVDGQPLPLSRFLTETRTTGLLVLHRGKIVSEQYFQAADRHARMTSWSMAKSVVATLVGQALAEGKIRSLDDQVKQYVPALAGKAYGEARIRDLLNMASGVQFDETYDNKFSDINRLFYKVFLLGEPIDDAAANYPAEVAPGTRFKYVSTDTQILARVLRAAVGENLSTYSARKLWHPLGVESTILWNLDRPDGVELAYCCLNMPLRDYARLGQLYLQDGRWQGQPLLPKGWVKQATTPDKPWLQPGGPRKDRGYAMQWWVPQGYDQEFMAQGVWGQMLWVSQKDEVVIVKTSVDPDHKQHQSMTLQAMRAIARFVGKQAS